MKRPGSSQAAKWPAPVDLVEVDEVAIGAPGPCLLGSIDVLGKHRDGHRDRDLGGLLRGSIQRASSAVLPVQPSGGGRAVRQPVQRDVVQHLVFRRGLFEIAAVRPLRETLMQEYERREVGRAILAAPVASSVR